MVSILITVLKKFDIKFEIKYNVGGGGGVGYFGILSMSAPARFGFKAPETNLNKNKIIKSSEKFNYHVNNFL